MTEQNSKRNGVVRAKREGPRRLLFVLPLWTLVHEKTHSKLRRPFAALASCARRAVADMARFQTRLEIRRWRLVSGWIAERRSRAVGIIIREDKVNASLVVVNG